MDRAGGDHTLGAILQLVQESAPLSRSDIAELTGLASSTVSVATAELQRRGLIRECGRALSTGGRRPILLEMNPDGGFFICVDVSGGEVAVAILGLANQVVYEWREPRRDREEAAFAQLLDLVQGARTRCERDGLPLLGIGIATPGLVDAATGVVAEADGLGWHDFPLRDKLAAAVPGVPIVIAHDATAATVGEYKFGDLAVPHGRNLLFVTVGNGIGAGWVLNGTIYEGAHGMAGELGHVVVDPNGLLCTCGNRGCLEAVAIGQPPSVLGQCVGLALANQVNALNLDTVLVGGRSGDREDVFAAIADAFQIGLMPKLQNTCRLQRATLGRRAGLIGVAALALARLV